MNKSFLEARRITVPLLAPPLFPHGRKLTSAMAVTTPLILRRPTSGSLLILIFPLNVAPWAPTALQRHSLLLSPVQLFQETLVLSSSSSLWILSPHQR